MVASQNKGEEEDGVQQIFLILFNPILGLDSLGSYNELDEKLKLINVSRINLDL